MSFPVSGAVSGLPPTRPSLRLLWGYVILCLALLPLLLLVGPARFTLTARLLAWLGLVVAGLPSLWLLLRPERRPILAAGVGLWLSLCYFLSVLHEDHLVLRWGEGRLSATSIELALLLAALTVPALLVGGWLAEVGGVARVVPALRLDVPIRPLQLVGAVVVALSLGADILWMRSELTVYQPAVSVISILTPSDLGFAMLLVPLLAPPSAHTPSELRQGRLLFWGLLITSALVGLMRGTLTPVVKPLLMYLIGWLLIGRRVRLWPVFAALCVVVLLQPVKGEFRARVWDREVRLSLLERAGLFVELAASHWLGTGGAAQAVDHEESVKTAAARTSSTLQLAHVIEMTPAAVPYQEGATYRYLRYALVPRVLYPDKPTAQYADVWAAVMYGYVHLASTAHVMIGLPQIAEAYLNFGFLGAVLLFVAMGVVLRVMDALLAHLKAGTGALALYLFFVEQVMINFEGSLAQFWGGALQQLVFYGTALFALGLLSRRRQGSPRAWTMRE